MICVCVCMCAGERHAGNFHLDWFFKVKLFQSVWKCVCMLLWLLFQRLCLVLVGPLGSDPVQFGGNEQNCSCSRFPQFEQSWVRPGGEILHVFLRSSPVTVSRRCKAWWLPVSFFLDYSLNYPLVCAGARSPQCARSWVITFRQRDDARKHTHTPVHTHSPTHRWWGKENVINNHSGKCFTAKCLYFLLPLWVWMCVFASRLHSSTCSCAQFAFSVHVLLFLCGNCILF